MMLHRRTTLLGVCVVAAALAVPATVLAGTQLSVRTAKKASGPYAETTPLHVPDGDAKSGYLRVRNPSGSQFGVTLSYELFGGSGPAYNIKWFKGKKNITADVGDDGYDFQLKAGASKVFRTKIKAPPDAEPVCVSAGTDIGGEFSGNAFFAVNKKTACVA